MRKRTQLFLTIVASSKCRSIMSEARNSVCFGILDCHAHISDKSFHEDRAQLLQNAYNRGVSGIIVVSQNVEDADAVLTLCREYDRTSSNLHLYPSIGIHPVAATLEALPRMIEMIDNYHESLICIGEIGLDFSRHIIGEGDQSHMLKEVQNEVFSKQILKAMEYDIAVNVHSRAAGHHAIKLLNETRIRKVLMHAFDGKPKYALAAHNDHGYLFSVAPSICRNVNLQRLVEKLPVSALVLETDCPALGPVQGKRAVPEDIATACEWVSQIKNISTDEVIRITSENARQIFPMAFLGGRT